MRSSAELHKQLGLARLVYISLLDSVLTSHSNSPYGQLSPQSSETDEYWDWNGHSTGLKMVTFNSSKLSLTKGSAMTIRILRSEIVVKLAKRLLSTYSPGRLSGSTLMGIMAGGPFSPCEQKTGGTGGLLYPEALDKKENK